MTSWITYSRQVLNYWMETNTSYIILLSLLRSVTNETLPAWQPYTLQILTAFHVYPTLMTERGTIINSVSVLIWTLILYFLSHYKGGKNNVNWMKYLFSPHVKIFMVSNGVISDMNIIFFIFPNFVYSFIPIWIAQDSITCRWRPQNTFTLVTARW